MAAAEIPIELHPLVQAADGDHAREESSPHRRITFERPSPLERASSTGLLVMGYRVHHCRLSHRDNHVGAENRRFADSFSYRSTRRGKARLGVVRILGEINTLLLTTLVAMWDKIASWATASSRAGVSIPLWLLMNPTTGTLGLLRLLLWGKRSKGKSGNWHHRAWIVVRYALCAW
jgi:hypothetical protein